MRLTTLTSPVSGNYFLIRSAQNLQFPLCVNTVELPHSPSKYSQLSTSVIVKQ